MIFVTEIVNEIDFSEKRASGIGREETDYASFT